MLFLMAIKITGGLDKFGWRKISFVFQSLKLIRHDNGLVTTVCLLSVRRDSLLLAENCFRVYVLGSLLEV